MAGGKRMIGKSPQTERSTVCLPEEETQKRTSLVDSSSVKFRATVGGDDWREGRTGVNAGWSQQYARFAVSVLAHESCKSPVSERARSVHCYTAHRLLAGQAERAENAAHHQPAAIHALIAEHI